MLLIWQANIDIQFIRDSSLVLDRYITSYITKSEKQATQEIWDTCNNNKTLQGSLKSYALKSFKNRESGIFEVTDKLLGYSLYEFSDVIKYISALPFNERKRALKDINNINSLDDEDTNIYHNNMLDNYYPNRPDQLENMCLHTLVSWFEYKSEKCNHKGDDCFSLKNNLGYLHKRKKPKVIKVPNIQPTDQTSLERHCYQMLLLFVAWRDERALKTTEQSYQLALNEANSKCLFSDESYSNFQIKKNKIKTAIEYINKINQENDTNLDNENNIADTDIYDLGVEELLNDIIDPNQVDQKIKSLNSEQLEIFNYIVQLIDHQEIYPKNEYETPKKVRIFCSGVAGNVYLCFINKLH